MSAIFTDAELTKIENHLGLDFIQTYEKIWGEMNGVKTYKAICFQRFREASGCEAIYWGYKLGEVDVVLQNQAIWLRNVFEPLEHILTKTQYAKLGAYLDEFAPVASLIQAVSDWEETKKHPQYYIDRKIFCRRDMLTQVQETLDAGDKIVSILKAVRKTLDWYKEKRDHWDWDNLFDDLEADLR